MLLEYCGLMKNVKFGALCNSIFNFMLQRIDNVDHFQSIKRFCFIEIRQCYFEIINFFYLCNKTNNVK